MSDDIANSIVTGIRNTPIGVWHDIQGSQSSVPINLGVKLTPKFHSSMNIIGSQHLWGFYTNSVGRDPWSAC